MKHGEQKLVARWCGLSAGFFCEILAGKKRPSSSRALTLQEKTGVDLRDWLYLPSDQLDRKLYLAWRLSIDVEGGKR